MSDDLVGAARALARELHAGQTRKCTDTSYFEGHLEPVAKMVRASGGSDVQIAAAYLHDAAEDAGGRRVLDRVAAEINGEVAVIVEHLSDSLTDTTIGTAKEDWMARKRRYLGDLADAPTEVLEVSVADKLHNAQSILADQVRIGGRVWKRFNEKRPERQLWYYSYLADVFTERLPDHPLTGELNRCLNELRDRVRAEVPDFDDRVATVSAEPGQRSPLRDRPPGP
jgi:GTP pyrophosphokinase